MGFPSKGCSIGLRPDASGSKSYAHVWNQLNGLKGIGSGVVADQCLPLSTGASIPKCRLRSNNLCRKRSQFARIQSSRNENEVGPSNLGGPGDRDVAGTTSVDDLWTYVIDSERPSSLVDFPYLEKDTSQESEGALRWEVIGIVMLQTESNDMCNALVTAMHQGFALRSAEIRYRFDKDPGYTQSLQLARPMRVLSKEERAQLPPNVAEYIAEREEEEERLKVAARALECLTGGNKLLAYYYSMSEQQKRELMPLPTCPSLELAFERAAKEVLKRLDDNPVFSKRNSWYFSTKFGGGTALEHGEGTVKLGRDYMATLLYWAMLIGQKLCDAYHRRDVDLLLGDEA